MEKSAKVGRMADQSTPHERTISPAQRRRSTAKADHSAQARLRWVSRKPTAIGTFCRRWSHWGRLTIPPPPPTVIQTVPPPYRLANRAGLTAPLPCDPATGRQPSPDRPARQPLASRVAAIGRCWADRPIPSLHRHPDRPRTTLSEPCGNHEEAIWDAWLKR